jgi:hypothetical protein
VPHRATASGTGSLTRSAAVVRPRRRGRGDTAARRPGAPAALLRPPLAEDLAGRVGAPGGLRVPLTVTGISLRVSRRRTPGESARAGISVFHWQVPASLSASCGHGIRRTARRRRGGAISLGA